MKSIEPRASRGFSLFLDLQKRFRRVYHPHIKSREYWTGVLLGFIFLSGALILNYYSGQYASSQVNNAVTDIVLSNTAVYEVDMLFTTGVIVFIGYIFVLCFCFPGKVPFILKTISLFVVIRSIAISLTHIGPFPTQSIIALSDFMQNFIFTGDLFFSGHTGLPFLMALIFWRHAYIRWISMMISVAFGIVVLLGHLHYSIDVFGAFFITYSVYSISRSLFLADYVIAEES